MDFVHIIYNPYLNSSLTTGKTGLTSRLCTCWVSMIVLACLGNVSGILI